MRGVRGKAYQKQVGVNAPTIGKANLMSNISKSSPFGVWAGALTTEEQSPGDGVVSCFPHLEVPHSLAARELLRTHCAAARGREQCWGRWGASSPSSMWAEPNSGNREGGTLRHTALWTHFISGVAENHAEMTKVFYLDCHQGILAVAHG